ncbi:MAG: GNAT family N-acetyltransferase [Candidatus ainarchaeum sp.]|jgi:RimJ/RimL family protein N-acetyltransferase|nr:GNAT family N-acetyltransferase [Candidatus ainarchaeum sp.]
MQIDKSKIYFETDRLIIRLLKPSDASDIFENYKDKVYSKNIPNLPYPYTLKHANDFIKKNKSKINRKKDPGIEFAIFSKEENRVIGGASLNHIDFKNKKCESGSCLSKKYWGKKYIYEAKLEIYKYAFNVLKLNKIYSYVLSHNLRSKKHLEKLGFKEVGYFKKDYFHKNKFVDFYRLDLLKEKFKYNDLKKELLS